jgi:hypothetical protein
MAATANASILPPVPKGSGDSSGVRFTLRKRSARSNDREEMTLSSYNSAFLSGLFADVAKANILSEFQLPETTKPPETAEVTKSMVIEDVRPSKRSRLSLSSCLSRPSCMDLSELSFGLQSPKGINEIFGLQKTEKCSSKESSTSPDLNTHSSRTSSPPSDGRVLRQDSLAFQLSLLDGHDEALNKATVSNGEAVFKDVALLAFPNLPVTVSDSSCYTGLTRDNLAQHVPISETDDVSTSNDQDKESSFGWFVDLDDHHDTTPPPVTKFVTHSVSTDDLAFHAPTAPKRCSDNSDIEWAQAADTVDSVLRDLF